MAKTKKTTRESSKTKSSPFKDYWVRNNYLLFYLGIGILIIGYYLMSFGPWDNPISLSVSPIVLLIGYIVILPFAILIKTPEKKSKEKNVSSEG